MNIEKLNHWLTLLANVGVIAGIVFLVIEIITATTAVQSASILELANASREGLLAIASDPDLARVRLKGDQDPNSLEGEDALRYFVYYRQLWLSFQNAWQQWELGVVSDDIWAGYNSALCGVMAVSGPRKEWPRHAPALTQRFVRVVESCSGTSDGFIEVIDNATQSSNK